MIALDLYCGAGGATRGLQNAGYRVIGVDINPQPNYIGDEFFQADALEFPVDGYDLVWASPPCQKYSTMTKRWKNREHPDLIEPTRQRIRHLKYVIENVMGAPLISPIKLCGSMFGLGVRRHRLFESSFRIVQPACRHHLQKRTIGVYGHAGGSSKRDGIRFGGVSEWREAMGIDWMTGKELSESIPPAYSQYIGKHAISNSA